MKPIDQWTDADIEALRAKWDDILFKIVMTTYILCSGMLIWAWTYRAMPRLLSLP